MIGGSPFLELPPSSWLAANRSAFAVSDHHPVSRGHSLVVPRRLITSWWELVGQERDDVWDLVAEVKTLLDVRHAPDGYNVGFNAGAAAGQTVEHLHIHVIPRVEGDVPNPRGGIRWVIPEKADYLAPGLPGAPPVPLQLVDGLDDRTLKLELLRCLINETFDRIDLLVSFIMRSGVSLVERHLRSAIDRGAAVRVLTTDYLMLTHPDALARLLDLSRRAEPEEGYGSVQVRAFQDPLTSFHPKAYLFWSSDSGYGRGFVGSNNLSRSGIQEGIEWSVETPEVSDLIVGFERLWNDRRSTPVDDLWVARYRDRFVEPVRVITDVDVVDATARPFLAEVAAEPEADLPTPRPIQIEALAALEATRAAGHRAGLVVMATGLGKTWLAAFDANRPEFPRVLFVAHREEILTQARDVFRSVRPEALLGFFTSAEKTVDADVVFATVQTLHRHLGSFPAGSFEYVVVDEFHHASARTYRRVLGHFQPRFLLGLTATPERLDGADLLALCGDNVPYRCDLVDGVQREELARFHYWGVADTVDFAPIPWRNGRFDPAALEDAMATRERADAAMREWVARAGERTLAFCSSIRHAEYMARHFQDLGVSAVALHSGSDSGLRTRVVDQLEGGALKVLFTVDLFNEGVDLPTLDTVLMLRPTESPVVFLQQLGRGLRIAAGKDHLDVVDFVGNHRAFLAPLRTLMSLRLGRSPTDNELLEAIRDKTLPLPAGCSVEYSLEAIDLLTTLIRERRTGATDVLRDLCLELTEDGVRPSALQVTLAGANVRAAKLRSGGWFELLDELGLLSPEEQRVVADVGGFLGEVSTTAMTRSFKMVLLQALLQDGRLRTGMPLGDLAAWSLQIIQSDPRLAADVDASQFPSVQVVETDRWERYWRQNPVEAWSGGKWFAIEGDRFVPRYQVADELGDAFDAMVAELVEWRLHNYFVRGAGGEASSESAAPLRVSHSSGTPIVRLDRKQTSGLPDGPVEFMADGERYTGRFMKVALNVATRPGTDGNVLPALLRRWFGPSAGHPGSDHKVVLAEGPGGWVLKPVSAHTAGNGSMLPHFPTYAVACGAFDSPVPADVAPRHQEIAGLGEVDPDEFLVTVRGDSMAGGAHPLRHGDLVRMRWTRRRTVESLVGQAVLVELGKGGERRPAMKLLDSDANGFVLRSTGEGYDDVPASHAVTVVGELVERVDPALWDPIGKWLGRDFRRDDVPALFGLSYNPGNWQSGHVSLEDDTVLFVTLDKEAGRSGEEYVDRFESADAFHWTSQSRTTPESKKGREIVDALDNGRRLHLFVRAQRQQVAFAYCGLVAPTRQEGSQPMTVTFRLLTPLSDALAGRFLRM